MLHSDDSGINRSQRSRESLDFPYEWKKRNMKSVLPRLLEYVLYSKNQARAFGFPEFPWLLPQFFSPQKQLLLSMWIVSGILTTQWLSSAKINIFFSFREWVLIWVKTPNARWLVVTTAGGCLVKNRAAHFLAKRGSHVFKCSSKL